MIKASGEHGGTPMLVLGLSRLNTERLLEGKPILVDAAQLGLPAMKVLLVGGETEDAITAELAEAMNIGHTEDVRTPEQRG